MSQRVTIEQLADWLRKREDIALFAKLTGTELVTIGDDTTEADLEKI